MVSFVHLRMPAWKERVAGRWGHPGSRGLRPFEHTCCHPTETQQASWGCILTPHPAELTARLVCALMLPRVLPPRLPRLGVLPSSGYKDPVFWAVRGVGSLPERPLGGGTCRRGCPLDRRWRAAAALAEDRATLPGRGLRGASPEAMGTPQDCWERHGCRNRKASHSE